MPGQGLPVSGGACKLEYKREGRDMSRTRRLNRRQALTLGAAAGTAAVLPGVASAQANFPNKPIKILVGFAPGGPSDLIARVVGAKMGEILGGQVVIENRTGAGGMIAAEAAARSEPD